MHSSLLIRLLQYRSLFYQCINILHRIELQQALSDDDKKLLKQRVAILDKQIDNAVYKLYNLTADEVKIVEGARKNPLYSILEAKSPIHS